MESPLSVSPNQENGHGGEWNIGEDVGQSNMNLMMHEVCKSIMQPVVIKVSQILA